MLIQYIKSLPKMTDFEDEGLKCKVISFIFKNINMSSPPLHTKAQFILKT